MLAFPRSIGMLLGSSNRLTVMHYVEKFLLAVNAKFLIDAVAVCVNRALRCIFAISRSVRIVDEVITISETRIYEQMSRFFQVSWRLCSITCEINVPIETPPETDARPKPNASRPPSYS